MFSLGGWREKIIVQNCGRALVKPKDQPGGAVLASGVTKSMVIPGPETEVIGKSGSEGLGAQPPDAEKSLILHVLRIA